MNFKPSIAVIDYICNGTHLWSTYDFMGHIFKWVKEYLTGTDRILENIFSLQKFERFFYLILRIWNCQCWKLKILTQKIIFKRITKPWILYWAFQQPEFHSVKRWQIPWSKWQFLLEAWQNKKQKLIISGCN